MKAKGVMDAQDITTLKWFHKFLRYVLKAA